MINNCNENISVRCSIGGVEDEKRRGRNTGQRQAGAGPAERAKAARDRPQRAGAGKERRRRRRRLTTRGGQPVSTGASGVSGIARVGPGRLPHGRGRGKQEGKQSEGRLERSTGCRGKARGEE